MPRWPWGHETGQGQIEEDYPPVSDYDTFKKIFSISDYDKNT